MYLYGQQQTNKQIRQGKTCIYVHIRGENIKRNVWGIHQHGTSKKKNAIININIDDNNDHISLNEK